MTVGATRTSRRSSIRASRRPRAKNARSWQTCRPNSAGVAYTAVVRGAGSTTGIGLIEVYDLDSGPGSTLLNIATRGRVGNDDERVMIGGFFVGGSESKRILIRGLGPSLTSGGVTGTLADPRLELVDAQRRCAPIEQRLANQRTGERNSAKRPRTDELQRGRDPAHAQRGRIHCDRARSRGNHRRRVGRDLPAAVVALERHASACLVWRVASVQTRHAEACPSETKIRGALDRR